MDERPLAIKTVIHLADKTVLKGYLETADLTGNGVAVEPIGPLPEQIELRLLDGAVVTVQLNQAKAVFFVNAFAGQPDYKELKFFKNIPDFPGIWVRLRFADHEVTEGLVQNSLDLLVHSGFFLKPPDPLSNNRMVYALKKHLIDFEILGLRSEY